MMKALEKFSNIEIQLYGKEDVMAPYLKQHDRLSVIPCEEVVS